MISRNLVKATYIQVGTSSRRLVYTSPLAHQQANIRDESLELPRPQLLARAPISNKLEIENPSLRPLVPMYRVLNMDGSLADELDPTLSQEKILELYKNILFLNTMDKVLFDSHRQGRISFYMTNSGEEALQVGSAGALESIDWVFGQYRETGVLIQRRMAIKLMLAQCFGNKHDLGKGRQMPIHYGSRALNFVTLSSPLATQMPQAAGAAYGIKLADAAALNQKQGMESSRINNGAGRRVVACYFGEGAASEGDAHAAMNFAATLSCPVVFICRNNGYAISTPATEQYAGDGIVSRAAGYGINSVRVDGNDLFAVYAATRAARALTAGPDSKPTLIEAMTYRLGHHSTSDDSSAYRSLEEVRAHELADNPLERVQKYLLSNGLWSDAEELESRQAAKEQILEALSWAERQKKLPIGSMFDDVYSELPANLNRQKEELRDHLASFGEHYPTEEHEGF